MSHAADNPPPTRCLVTGGAGHIGSHLVERLLERGCHVTVLDDLSTGRRDNLPDGGTHLRFVEADIAKGFGMLNGERFDEVYHLAAAVGVELVLRDPARAIEVNVHGTAELLRYAADHGCPPTLIASSSEVYGKPGTAVFSEEDDAVYGATSITRWSYACSKALDEHLALAYHRDRALPVVVARFFNTVGPRQVGSYGMVLPRFVASALRNEPLRVFGDGEQSRCFCDVRDATAVLPELLATPACRGRVFNVGADTPITIMALAELVIETVGSASTIERVPYADAYPAGFEDLRQRRPDLTRLRQAVAFEPRHTLRETILEIARAQRSRTAGGVA